MQIKSGLIYKDTVRGDKKEGCYIDAERGNI